VIKAIEGMAWVGLVVARVKRELFDGIELQLQQVQQQQAPRVVALLIAPDYWWRDYG
jgi:hypothetical protein